MAWRSVAANELVEAAVAFLLPEEGELALVEDRKEFVPVDSFEAIVVIAAGLVEIDPQHAPAPALSLGIGNDRGMSVVLLDPSADRIMVGRGGSARHDRLHPGWGSNQRWSDEFIAGQIIFAISNLG